MKSGLKPLALVLAIAGILDVVMVPFMATAPASNAPPAAATILSGVVGLATLAAIPGVMQGRKCAFWVAIVTRVVDLLNSFMGAAFGPAVLFKVVGVVLVAASVATLVLLVRLIPRRALAAEA
jgi:hypothetical protein